MPVQPLIYSALETDFAPRVIDTTTVQNSPIAAAAETIIATVNIPNFGGIAITQRIYLNGWAAFTVGGSGTAATLRIRQTNVTGTVIVTTGALTGGIAAAALVAQDVGGSDATPGVATYVLTLQITSGATNTTISAVQLLALVV